VASMWLLCGYVETVANVCSPASPSLAFPFAPLELRLEVPEDKGSSIGSFFIVKHPQIFFKADRNGRGM